MTTETLAPAQTRDYFGYLSVETAEEIARRIKNILGVPGRVFTLVESYDDLPNRVPDVHVGLEVDLTDENWFDFRQTSFDGLTQVSLGARLTGVRSIGAWSDHQTAKDAARSKNFDSATFAGRRGVYTFLQIDGGWGEGSTNESITIRRRNENGVRFTVVLKTYDVPRRTRSEQEAAVLDRVADLLDNKFCAPNEEWSDPEPGLFVRDLAGQVRYNWSSVLDAPKTSDE